MSLRVHHLAIIVVDLERSEHFYREVLGLPVLKRWSDAAGKPRSVWLRLEGDAFLAIERAREEEPRANEGAPGMHCVALGITKGERERWRERLREAGFAVERESAYTLYVRDPEGNLVGLSHWPDPRD
jgi:glyoxylase I family protein